MDEDIVGGGDLVAYSPISYVVVVSILINIIEKTGNSDQLIGQRLLLNVAEEDSKQKRLRENKQED
ncbi:hypothetical protein Syun_014451 [Stephania yunnanensis]|uniref:Uncharacterized protein n=1 Tax=Stephania yunnanensis TaxID=152371 RepID=A0AAP0JKF0_9MAGN